MFQFRIRYQLALNSVFKSIIAQVISGIHVYKHSILNLAVFYIGRRQCTTCLYYTQFKFSKKKVNNEMINFHTNIEHL